MSDYNWQPMDWDLGQRAIRELHMKKLPISCERYYYFGVYANPFFKVDSRKRQFYYNEDYENFSKKSS